MRRRTTAPRMAGKTIVSSATETIHELFKRAAIPYTIKMFPWYARSKWRRSTKELRCVYSTTRTEKREKAFF
ncbi:MAG: hypothetical protein IPG34_15700 [Rhodocyclaceae bacterium]|nr:hypothetical protein [Rhodocyclaceae bacterium]